MEGIKAYKPQVNPLRFMWIAHFKDGTSLPEFDPYLYEKNSMGEVFDREDDLIKFGIYPIPPKLANEINNKGLDTLVSIPFFPHYEVNLDKNKRLIFFRRNFIHSESYYKCLKCNREFQKYKMTGGTISSPICPHCGAHDLFICKNCGKVYQSFDDAPNHMCECGGHLKHEKITSSQYGRERRVREHHIGYQEIVNGVNIKSILKIDQEGNVEVIYK